MTILIDPEKFFVQVQIDFATDHGLNEAILSAKMFRLQDRLQGNLDDNGDKWVRMTLEEWHKDLPFFSPPTIRRTIDSCEKQGIILSRTFQGRSKWYRLNPEMVAGKPKMDATDQNDQMQLIKMISPNDQNDQLPTVLPTVLPKERESHAEKNPELGIKLKAICGYEGNITQKVAFDLLNATRFLESKNVTVKGLAQFKKWWWGSTPPTPKQVCDNWDRYLSTEKPAATNTLSEAELQRAQELAAL